MMAEQVIYIYVGGQSTLDVYIYMGGNDVVPYNATHVRVHESIKVIPEDAFKQHLQVVEFECHDGVERIEKHAFQNCYSLRRVIIPGVTVVEEYAFHNCVSLTDVTFGDKLETIGRGAFYNCPSLTRITIPLKDGMITHDNVFQKCKTLECVDLVDKVHETIAALQLEQWRDDMNEEIGRINQILPNTPAEVTPAMGVLITSFDELVGRKAQAVRVWIQSVLRKMEYYKAAHRGLLKEAATTLELALWKSRLCGDNNDVPEGDKEKRAECRNDCGADMNIIIPNVLSFLKIE